jgi:hypothetical protein
MSFDKEKPPHVASVQGLGNGRILNNDHSENVTPTQSSFPHGLLGEVAQFIFDVSPRPVPQIALAGAIALMSGICGRAFNVSGTGVNQYVLLMATTGTGKDAIASGVGKLFAAIAKSVPTANDFRGPGELVSSAGLIKWMDKKPAVLCVLGEIGLMMQQMAHINAKAHIKGLQRTLLQMYSKSGKGETFDPSAYSDKEKNTGFIYSPSLTIVGETVPHTFYEMLDEGMIASGLLPRFLTFEYVGERGYLVEGREKIEPPFRLVQALADLSAQALGLAHNSEAHNVPFTDEAQLRFRQYDHWTTDQINAAKTETVRHLWNRAHLKAMKLAAIAAIGINPTHPVITINETIWATSLVAGQTQRLLAKFANGETGHEAGNEVKQQRKLRAVIRDYIKAEPGKYEKSGCTFDMHRDHIFSLKYLSNRLINLPTFSQDKSGASRALQRTIDHLLENDEIRRVGVPDMMKHYGKASKSFGLANENDFMKGED